MHYHFKIHKEGNGYWAECIELKGCYTQGASREELAENMHEALNLYLDEPESSKYIFPLPRRNISGRNIEFVFVEPSIAFALLLKRERLKNKWTQKDVAKKLGIKNLYSYQRLEDPKKANPALKTIKKIKSIFPGLKIEEVLA
jgi:antitoxin HicB